MGFLAVIEQKNIFTLCLNKPKKRKEKIVVITAETKIFEKYAKEFFDVKKFNVRYGGLMTGVFVCDLDIIDVI